jgi:hypothetical protein
MTFVGAPDEPLTLQLVERSRTTQAIVPVGAVRIPLPGAEVKVELHIDVDSNSTMAVGLDDLTNKTARTYYMDEGHVGRYFLYDRMRLLAEGWTLHPPAPLTPTSVTDHTTADKAGPETLATVDHEAELARLADRPVELGYLLTGLGRAGEALGLLMPLLAERPRYEPWVPEVCTAACVALARVPAKYREAGIHAVVDRLTYTTSLPTYDPRSDRDLPLCVARLSALGPHAEIAGFAEHVAAVRERRARRSGG